MHLAALLQLHALIAFLPFLVEKLDLVYLKIWLIRFPFRDNIILI